MVLGILTISGSLTYPVATQMCYQSSRKDKLCSISFIQVHQHVRKEAKGGIFIFIIFLKMNLVKSE